MTEIKKQVKKVEESKTSLNQEERDLMILIAKEVDDVKKRPWFKRLDELEQKGMLEKMTAPENIQEQREDTNTYRIKAGGAQNDGSTCVISILFDAETMEQINDRKDAQIAIKDTIVETCRKYGIKELSLKYLSGSSGPGGVPVKPVTTP